MRDKTLMSTDMVGSPAGIPVVSGPVNVLNKNQTFRGILEDGVGVHKDAKLPAYHSKPLRSRVERDSGEGAEGRPPAKSRCSRPATATATIRKVARTWSCVPLQRHTGHHGGQRKMLRHAEAGTRRPGSRRAKDVNIPMLAKLVDAGWDIVAPVPSCVLMFKQELPLMFPDDPDVAKVRDAM